MKRISIFVIFLIIVLFSLFICTDFAFAAKKKTTTSEEVKTNEKVKVYMITKDGCPACEMAYEFFNNYSKENDNFELIPFEVFDSSWEFNSNELKTMFVKVYEYFNEDASQAQTPTIVIGDYHTIGVPKDTSLITDAIKNAKTDVVEKIAKENNLNIDELKKVKSETKTNEEDKSGKYDTIIIIGIFVLLIGGFAGLLKLGKK